ncbi:ParB/Srx family N-terminal domain-containing protein [Cronobacter malonaticus]
MRSKLMCYERNVMQHSDAQIEQIAASIKEFGWTNPVLIDEDGEIIAGHGRLAAAELLGIDLIPAITLRGLSDAQKRAYRLADNKIPLGAGWDSDLLKLEISGLIDDDFDIHLTGFSQQEIDDLLIDFETPAGGDIDYTTKIDTPIYEPSDTVPDVYELYDDEKTGRLRENILRADLPDDIRRFLLSAAERHTVFNFNKIADYYASAPAEIQALFEESALVIIDFDKAIEYGFVNLTKKMVEIVYGDHGGDDA